MKRCLLLGRKAITNLDRVLKRKDITFPTKVHIVKAIVFPVVMYGCENWTTKKTEHWRIDVFELWCWRRLLTVPWTARRSNPVNPKRNQPWILIGRTDAEVEAPILGPPDVEKTSKLGKIEGKRSGWQRMRWLDSIIISKGMNLSKLWEIVQDRGAWLAAVQGVPKSRTWLKD